MPTAITSSSEPPPASRLRFLSPAIPRIPAVLSLLVLTYIAVVLFAPKEAETTRNPTLTEIILGVFFWPISLTALSLSFYGFTKLATTYKKTLPSLTRATYVLTTLIAAIWLWLFISLIIQNS